MRVTKQMRSAKVWNILEITGMHKTSPWSNDTELIGKKVQPSMLRIFSDNSYGFLRCVVIDPFKMNNGNLVNAGEEISIYGCYWKPVFLKPVKS